MQEDSLDASILNHFVPALSGYISPYESPFIQDAATLPYYWTSGTGYQSGNTLFGGSSQAYATTVEVENEKTQLKAVLKGKENALPIRCVARGSEQNSD